MSRLIKRYSELLSGEISCSPPSQIYCDTATTYQNIKYKLTILMLANLHLKQCLSKLNCNFIVNSCQFFMRSQAQIEISIRKYCRNSTINEIIKPERQHSMSASKVPFATGMSMMLPIKERFKFYNNIKTVLNISLRETSYGWFVVHLSTECQSCWQ